MALPTKIRGFLIDLDGTVTEASSHVLGVPDSLAFLRVRNVPYRLVTNTTGKPRSTLLTNLRNLGSDLPTGAIITAPIIGRESSVDGNLNSLADLPELLRNVA